MKHKEIIQGHTERFDFASPDPVFVVKFETKSLNSTFEFHLAIWAIVNDISDFAVALLPVSNHRKDRLQIAMFRNWEHAEKLREWLNRRILDGFELYQALPAIVGDGSQKTIWPLPLPADLRDDWANYGNTWQLIDTNKMVFDFWTWIVQNCGEPVYVIGDYLAFTNSNDAVAYKLKWLG